MSGMNTQTGQVIDGLDHLYQSIAKILTTPLGTRIGRREFGSELFNLVDAPNNAATRVRLYAATAAALMQWEPRLKVTRIRLADDAALSGLQVIEIEGTTTISGDLVSTSVPITPGNQA